MHQTTSARSIAGIRKLTVFLIQSQGRKINREKQIISQEPLSMEKKSNLTHTWSTVAAITQAILAFEIYRAICSIYRAIILNLLRDMFDLSRDNLNLLRDNSQFIAR